MAGRPVRWWFACCVVSACAAVAPQLGASSTPPPETTPDPVAVRALGSSGDVTTPLHAILSIDSLPRLGQQAAVTCEVTADRAAPGTTATLELPANARRTAGDLSWRGDLAAGESASFTARIVFDTPADSTILCRTQRAVDRRNSWGDLAALYLGVGLDATREGFAPVDRAGGIHDAELAEPGTGVLIGGMSVPRTDDSAVPPPPGHEPLPPRGAKAQPRPCPPPDAKPGATGMQPTCGNFSLASSPADTGSDALGTAAATADAPTGNLTVTGTWSYYDRNDVFTPALEFLVELIRGDDSAHLAWCFTGLDGNYSCGPVTNPGGVGVRTVLHSWSNYNPNPDTLTVVNPDWGTSNAIANAFRNQTGVAVLPDGTQSIGSWYIFNGDSYERAYWTQRDINEEWRYIFFGGGGGTPGPTTVQWKIDSIDGTYYNPGSRPGDDLRLDRQPAPVAQRVVRLHTTDYRSVQHQHHRYQL